MRGKKGEVSVCRSSLWLLHHCIGRINHIRIGRLPNRVDMSKKMGKMDSRESQPRQVSPTRLALVALFLIGTPSMGVSEPAGHARLVLLVIQKDDFLINPFFFL
jgi:hypothetical protein